MDFIQNLGMPQRLLAAVVVMLILALLLVRKRQGEGAKASTPKEAKAKRAKAPKGERRAGKRAIGKPTADKKGRRKRRGKDDDVDEQTETTPAAIGRMVPRLPSPSDGHADDPFAGAIGPVDEAAPMPMDQAPVAAHAQPGTVADPGWPTADEEWSHQDDASTAGGDQTTGVIEAVADRPAAPAETGWVEDEIEGFDPATGWGEDAIEETAPVADPVSETNSEWTEEASDWTSDGASWETVEADDHDASTWTTADEATPQTEWTAAESEPEEVAAAWDPVDEDHVADVEPSFSDWGTDAADEDASWVAPAPQPDETPQFSWDAEESVSEVDEAPVLAAAMAPNEIDAMAGGPVSGEVFDDIATGMPLVFDDEPAVGPEAMLAPAVDPAPLDVVDVPTPLQDDAFAAYDDASNLDTPATVDSFGAATIDEVPMLAEAPMSGFGTIEVDHVAPSSEPLTDPGHSEPVAAPIEVVQVVAEPEPPVSEPAFAVVEPVVSQPDVTPEPVVTAPVYDPVDALINGPAALRAPEVEAEAEVQAPVAETPSDDVASTEATAPSMVMAAPVRNPLDRWAHLTPRTDSAATSNTPIHSWARLVPGQPVPRIGADAPATEPVAVATVSAPAEHQPAASWWDTPASDGELTQRRGRFALGGYALCPGHQVVSGVTFREAAVPPPVDWVIGPVSGPVPAGTLVLNVDGCLNCRVEDLTVLMEAGFAPTTDGFSLRLTGLQQGPFAASGTFVIH